MLISVSGALSLTLSFTLFLSGLKNAQMESIEIID